MAISSVALSGPPSVMTKMRSKYFSEPIVDNVAAVMIVGMRSGSLMRVNVFHGVHPSMRAASSSSSGMPVSPARSKIM
ncbi:MAG: hypothetical protein A9Z00_13085 [Thermobacillus sp. ZCTH02-B1]|nr:MAG: hypothetical protein A9Z00_13085 [Thermobacillus sp. ZCTH02-B1]